MSSTCTTTAGGDHDIPSSPILFLVIANISKRCNIRSLIASALAFGAEVLIVGQPKFSIETHAPSGLPPGFSVTRFPDLSSCRDYVHSRGGTLIGVEIGDGAKNVDEEPFSGTCAFMPGNEGSGMNGKQKSCCDSFVYISQHGGGTASLNVTVAASIILHRYAGWRSDRGGGGGGGAGAATADGGSAPLMMRPAA
ncbi:unnamed protein product [Pylaiella littoralis]